MKYKLLFIGILFACVFNLNANVTVFEHGNYGGKSQTLKVGKHNYSTLNSGVGNDKISSVKVDKGYRITFFEHSNFSGGKKSFTSNSSSVGNDFNDKASSVIVEKLHDTTTPVTIYSEQNFGGICQTFEVGKHDQNKINILIGNDKTKSIKVNPGYKAVVYDYYNFGGPRKIFTKDASSIGSDMFGKVSCISVEKTYPNADRATLFSTTNYSGFQQSFGVGKHDQEELSQVIGKSTLSLKLNKGYGITLYGNNFSEPKKTLTQNTSSVGNDIKGKISCIEVFRSDLPKDKVSIGSAYFDTGSTQNLSVGEYTAKKLSIGDNKLSAIYVPKGFVAILYDKDNFAGDSIAFNATENSIRVNNFDGIFDKRVSSIMVAKVE